MSDHYDRYNGMENLLGTNSAEVGTDSAWTAKGFPIDADLLMLKAEEEYGFRARDRLYGIIRNMPKYELTSAQPEPIRINLNEPIKVKLTDWGKEIYYHQYDRANQIAGREICKPKFPKEDENEYTEFQLWCFMELYGEHMGMTLPNVIEPLEIVYER